MSYPQPTDIGLIALWQFENNLLDSGPSGYHLLASGSPYKFYQDTNIPHGSYAYQGNYNTLGDTLLGVPYQLHRILNSGYLNSITFEGLAYITGNNINGTMISQQRLAGSLPIGFIIAGSSPNRNIQSSYQSGAIVSNTSASFFLNSNQWNHFGVTHNYINKITKIYINNQLVASGANSSGFLLNNAISTTILSTPQISPNPSGLSGANGYFKNFAIYNYEKTSFENPSSGVLKLNTPDNTDGSYSAAIFDSNFNLITNMTKITNTRLEASVNVSGTNDANLFLAYKNKWVCARGSLTGIQEQTFSLI